MKSAADEAPSSAREQRSVTLGGVFLMATSAIGPGFLTQTALFTAIFGADFAFAILASVVVDIAVQANVWRVLGVTRMRGQELASALVPGLGLAVAVLVGLGGLAFNIGNVAGCGLGLNVFGMPTAWGAFLSGIGAVVLLWRPKAGRALDVFAKTLAAVKILLTACVMVWTHPDYAAAARALVMPSRVAFLPIVTLVGGTVGGYITFAGVHRLLDAGIGGPGAARRLGRAAITGIVITALMRMLLFLAVLGVVGRGGVIDRGNPAASAFRLGAGEWGYHLFGVVLWAAAMSSVVGCSYTSLSFFRTGDTVRRGSGVAVALFIGVSLAIYLAIGRPVGLLVAAGALNGLILPVTLGVVLLAARRRDLLGEYRHPWPLAAAGWAAWAVSAVAGVRAVIEAVGAAGAGK